MSRVNKFKRYYQHEETGRITAICWGNIDNDDNPVSDFSVFKSPSTISRWYPIADCEFVGLKDKKEIDIYEDDKILFTDFFGGKFKAYMGEWIEEYEDLEGVVKYSNGSFYVVDASGTEIPISEIYEQDKIEVVGNIYENTELL